MLRIWISRSGAALAFALMLSAIVFACGSETIVVQTVEVEKVVERAVPQTVVVEKEVQVAGETVIQTVVVEKEVQVAGETVVQTVVIEKEVQVAGETVVQTVVVEKEVQVAGETVIQTVVIEKEVEKEVQVEVTREVEVEVVVTATAEAYGAGAGAETLAAATAVVEAPTSQSGKLVVISPDIGAGWFTSSPYDDYTSDNFGVADAIIYADPAPVPQRGTFNPAISIANGWKVAEDGRSITFNIRDGVQFHHGWGELTAEDVAWSFNDALREGNTNSRSGFVGEYQGSWEAVDDNTVIMHVKEGATLSPVWLLETSNVWRNTLTATSKRAIDELGKETGGRKIGQGPFMMIEGEADNFIEFEAVTEHYRKVPAIEAMRMVAIPEPATRVAAFVNGEVHISVMSAQFVLEATGQLDGSRVQPLGEGQTLHIYMGGNFWQTSDPVDPSTEFPREGWKPDADHPWISDPNDPASMERGNKFRRALSMAVDRAAINEVIGQGLYPPHYTFTGFTSNDPLWKPEWEVPFDPEGARALMAEAGVEEGFTMPVWLTPDSGSLPFDIAEAAVLQWAANLNLNVEIDATAYSGNRPKLIGRTIDIPLYHHMNLGYFDEPKGRLMTAAKGGANRGIELPNDLLEKTYWANLIETDAQKRIENNIFLTDWLAETSLVMSMVRQSQLYAVSPEVAEWAPYTETFGSFNGADTIVLR